MSLYDRYINFELPHVHISTNYGKNIFEDALSIQADRILNNLQKQFPQKKRSDLIQMMFPDTEEYEPELTKKQKFLCHWTRNMEKVTGTSFSMEEIEKMTNYLRANKTQVLQEINAL